MLHTLWWNNKCQNQPNADLLAFEPNVSLSPLLMLTSILKQKKSFRKLINVIMTFMSLTKMSKTQKCPEVKLGINHTDKTLLKGWLKLKNNFNSHYDYMKRLMLKCLFQNKRFKKIETKSFCLQLLNEQKPCNFPNNFPMKLFQNTRKKWGVEIRVVTADTRIIVVNQ